MKCTLLLLLLPISAQATELDPRAQPKKMDMSARPASPVTKDGVEYSVWEETEGCQPKGATCVSLLAYQKAGSRDLWKTPLYKVVINKNVMAEIQRNPPSYLGFKNEKELEVIDDHGKHYLVRKNDGKLISVKKPKK